MYAAIVSRVDQATDAPYYGRVKRRRHHLDLWLTNRHTYVADDCCY
jgi:hypothetical protein